MYKNFNFVEVMKQLSHKIMSFAMGRYFLSRNVGDANGVFMVIFKKIKGEWKIVADMSCG
ncbi:hypothetical protein N8836_01430 [Flavobacteriaceae bacterium]|jgi:hypothetical protein|nr:hypothetical protein [Flavobacteriaceae bacterium]